MRWAPRPHGHVSESAEILSRGTALSRPSFSSEQAQGNQGRVGRRAHQPVHSLSLCMLNLPLYPWHLLALDGCPTAGGPYGNFTRIPPRRPLNLSAFLVFDFKITGN